MIRGVSANTFERELVDVAAIDMADAIQDVPTPVVDGGERGPRGARRVDGEGTRIRHKPFVGVHFDVGWVRDRHELGAVEEQRFLELVGDAQFVFAIARPEPSAVDADVLVGIGVLRRPGASQ